MRVLILNWYDLANPAAGGAERYLHEIGSRLAARGFRITLLCRRFAGSAEEEAADGIRIVRVPVPRGGLLLQTPALIAGAWRHYRRHRADYDLVVDCVNKVPFFTPCYVDRPRLALQFHFNSASFSAELPPGLAHAAAALERVYFRLYAGERFVTISASTRAELGRFGISPSRSWVVRCGVSPATATTVTPATRPTLVYVGRLKKYKRVDLLLQAFSMVLRDHSDARLIVVGDGPERAALEALARSLGIAASVEFAGHVDDERRQEVVASSWVNAIASQKEGWGLSVVEAGMLGVPTVASDVPGLCESVVPGRTGYLVPYGDARAMAAALADLIDHPGRRRLLGEQARAFAASHTWEAAAAELQGHLWQLAGQGVREPGAAGQWCPGSSRR